MSYKKRSILVLTTSFPVYEGIAVGIHVLEKCRNLVKKGWDVQVIAPGHYKAKRQEKVDGINVKRFSYFFPEKMQKLAYGAGMPTNLKQSWLARIQLPLFIGAFFIHVLLGIRKIDLIHCHWSLAGLIGVLAGKITNKKVVFMMHGAEVFVLGDHPLLKFVLKNCDFLICNSSFSMKKTLAVYPVKQHKVIPPGVDTTRFYPQQRISDLRYQLKIPYDHLFILTIGKFIERKGIEYLIKAFHILINTKGYRNIHLRIGGRGPLKNKYELLIHEYNLEKYIAFLGFIGDEDIPSYYTEADIFVLPSIVAENGDTEGLGVVFLEANACHTPVVGSKVGGIVDVIHDGENGYFIEQKNANDLVEKIERLIIDNNKRKKMGKWGREMIINKFNWDSIVKQIIISVYNEIV